MRFRKMMDYFEDYYRDSPEMSSLMKVEAAGLDRSDLDIKDVFAQTAIQTATWMIPTYEQIFALEPDPDDTLEFRRKRLLAYQRLRSPTTRKEFKNYLSPFVDSVEIFERFAEYIVEFTFTGDDINFKEINRMLRRSLPAHLGWQLVLKWYQEVKIRHTPEIWGIVNAGHNVWNLGRARTTRFDGEFNFDRTIRLDGIYGDYSENQRHTVQIWYVIKAIQRNLVPTNVFDGNFCFDGSHTWRGMSMTRLPIHKSASSSAVMGSHHKMTNHNAITAVNCPDVYLFNPVVQSSNNMQYAASPQPVQPKQISAATQTEKATHQQGVTLAVAAVPYQETTKKINTEHRVMATNQLTATHNSDYRTANLMDGSFCMDGTHTFGGTVNQNYAQATHVCAITRISNKGIGRIESV